MKEKKNILVVEDEKPMATALKNKLGHLGYDVVVVNNGAEALEELANAKFDLMLTDLMMPNMDGFELLQKVKLMDINIPVIVSSNLSQEQDFEKATELGAVDYFIKSNISIKEIVERIENALSHVGGQ